jgi:chromosome segregation ATPase
MTRPLGIIEQYWRRATASIFNAFGQQSVPQPRMEELEREILTLSKEIHGLTGSLERFRTDCERQRSEILHKFQTLEHAQTQEQTARTADASQLEELNQRLVELETERGRLTEIETSLAETTNHLETRHNQLKFLQDSARGQIETFKTALAEATSRLETRDNELERLLDPANERLAAFETSLADTVIRFQTTADEIRELREGIADLARQSETSQTSATTLLETTNNRVEALEKQIAADHRLLQNMYQDMQARLQRQDKRLVGIFLVAVLALVAVTGIILL